MPLITSGPTPQSKGTKLARGQKSSSVLASEAQAELDKIVNAVLADMAKILPDWDKQPESASIVMALGDLQAKWQAEIAATSNKVAAQWIDAVDTNSKSELVSSLKKALGVSQAKVLDTPGMRATVTAMGLEASGLIKSIPGELLAGVADAVVKSYNQEGLPEGRSLSQEIAFISGHAKKRARLIARDQTQKMHGVVTRTRQAELGIEEFIWRTMKDARVVGTPGGKYPDGSRLHGNHYEREGKKYRWDNLPADGGPGWGINCRCYAEPVIDMDKLDLISVSPPVMEEVVEATAPKKVVKAAPEPFPGFKAKQDALLQKLLAQEQVVSGPMPAGMSLPEFQAIQAKAKKQMLSIKSSLSKLKAKGLKAASDSSSIKLSTTSPVVSPPEKEAPVFKPAEKPKPKQVLREPEAKPAPKVSPEALVAAQELSAYISEVPQGANLVGLSSGIINAYISGLDKVVVAAAKFPVNGADVYAGNMALKDLRQAYNVAKSAEAEIKRAEAKAKAEVKPEAPVVAPKAEEASGIYLSVGMFVAQQPSSLGGYLDQELPELQLAQAQISTYLKVVGKQPEDSDKYMALAALKDHESYVARAIKALDEEKEVDKKLEKDLDSKPIELQDKIKSLETFTSLDFSDIKKLSATKLSQLDKLAQDVKYVVDVRTNLRDDELADDTLSDIVRAKNWKAYTGQNLAKAGRAFPDLYNHGTVQLVAAPAKPEDLKPIPSMIHGAQGHYKITEAKEKTGAQLNAIRKYGGAGYSDINRATRSARALEAADPWVKGAVKQLDKVIAMSTVDENLQTFRGVRGDISVRLAAAKVGDIVTLPSYSSVSTSWSVGSSFAGGKMTSNGIVMEIQIPKGANAISVYNSGVAGTRREKELLLPRNSSFRVIENGDNGLVLKLVKKKDTNDK